MSVIACAAVLYALLRLINFLYGVFWHRRLTLNLFFSEDAVFEGERVKLSEVLTNAKALPLPWVTVKFQVSRHLLFFGEKMLSVSDDCYKKDVFSVFSFQKITRVFDVKGEKRGFYFIKSAELISYNLLYNEKYVRPAGGKAALTVYPKLLNFHFSDMDGRVSAGEIVKRRFDHDDPFTFRSIREYCPLDPAKHINARASAKNARLMVNTFDAAVSKEVVVYLNLQKYAPYVSEAVFEKAISLAASLARFYLEQNVSVRLISGSYDCFALGALDSGFGTSKAHFFSILSALAKLDINNTEKIADFLPNPPYRAHRNRLYILISTYADAELTAKFNGMKNARAAINWIMPHTRDMLAQNAPSAVFKWNIDYEPETRFIV